MDECWAIIDEFPMYRVSDKGRVVNEKTGKILKESETRTGLVKIGLVYEGAQYTRSLSILVAEAFVEGRSDVFTTPIHLDGNQRNNRADNLLWRPRWFAWKYTRQFVEVTIHHTRGPMMDMETKQLYTDMFEVATTHGILIEDIWRSVLTKKPTFPTWQVFSIVK